MAKFLCKECRKGIVTRVENSEVDRAWCSITKQYLVGKVIECSAFGSKKVRQKKEGK